jgi:hypothetical protein
MGASADEKELERFRHGQNPYEHAPLACDCGGGKHRSMAGAFIAC